MRFKLCDPSQERHFAQQGVLLGTVLAQQSGRLFILRMFLEEGVHALQRLARLGSFVQFRKPGFFVCVDLGCISFATRFAIRDSFLLVAKLLIQCADFLQGRRGRFQRFFCLDGLLLSRLQGFGLFLGRDFQSGQCRLFGFQGGLVSRLLFAGGGECGVCAVQRGGTQGAS